MEPKILDLREERCPMALLLAKRASTNLGEGGFEVYLSDKSSMLDIQRYFEKNNFLVQIENNTQHYVLIINKVSTCSDA